LLASFPGRISSFCIPWKDWGTWGQGYACACTCTCMCSFCTSRHCTRWLKNGQVICTMQKPSSMLSM
jgi:hypothetical protein